MKIKKTIITPARARELLSGNIRNRNVRSSHVDYLATEIVNGRWQCTHQGIAIAEDGTVVDGQHRLLACVQANTPIEVMLAEGVPISVQDATDGGAVRSVADQLHLSDGLANANHTIAAVRAIVYTCLNGNNVKLSVPVAREIHQIYSREIESVLGLVRDHKPLLRGWIVGALALALHADRKSAEFIQNFSSGENLSKGDPALAARNWIINGNAHLTHRSYRYASVQALLNSVYNSIQGNKITQIKRGAQGSDYFLSRERKNVTTFREQFAHQLLEAPAA